LRFSVRPVTRLSPTATMSAASAGGAPMRVATCTPANALRTADNSPSTVVRV
jgi:hypothetical protein